MRGLEPTIGLLRSLVGIASGLAAVALATTALGQVAPPRSSSEPIVLAADGVHYWDESPLRHWVVLDGRAAVLQGLDGLRADRIVARIDAGAEEEGRRRISLYAEGRARSDDAPGQLTGAARAVREGREVRIEARDQGGPQRWPRPPDALAPLLARAFPPGEGPTPPRPDGDAEIVPMPPIPRAEADPAVQRVQFQGDEVPFVPPGLDPPDEDPPPADLPEVIEQPGMPPLDAAPEDVEDLPPSELPPSELPPEMTPPPAFDGPSGLLPSTRRIVTIGPRGSTGLKIETLTASDGVTTIAVIRGGVQLSARVPTKEKLPDGQFRMRVIDISADSAILWTRGGSGPQLEQEADVPLEVYLEGNVIFLKDDQQVAGSGDQTRVVADSFYYDFRTEWFLADQAEFDLNDAKLIAPIKVLGDRVQQYRPILDVVKGKYQFGPAQVRADRALMTGSRFPVPGYRFTARSVDLLQLDVPLQDPNSGQVVGDAAGPEGARERAWRIDSRQNVYFIGSVPAFYWPRVQTDSDDLDPPLRGIQFRANNYFGQQFLTDWSMFKLLGIKKPPFIDTWNLDLDYLSYRGFAVGQEIGWYGRDLFSDLTNPYRRPMESRPYDRPYFGYFDIWGLRDRGIDDLGAGPAVVTYGPPGFGKRGFQRGKVPPPPNQNFRGRFQFRHMQYFVPSTATADEDFRLQIETAYESDRHFLEQYYKRLFETGLEQNNVAYLYYQRENRAATVLAEGVVQDWYTQGQYFPKLDYFRLGDSLFGGWLNWSQNWGADYANTHTAVEVNNPNIFAFLAYDPVTLTSGPFRTGRLWTSHQLEMPIDLTYLRVVPYAQGQLVGWDNQYAAALPAFQLQPELTQQQLIRGGQGDMLGRAWGAAGARANVMAWKIYPDVESELLNLHGLNHKINFLADYRTAYSSFGINRIGIQDNLDDNTYEFVRRYFALTNYVTGVLPPQYNPLLLTMRRAVNPVVGTTDVQGTIETLQLGIHQRLQTKRGPDGRRRIIDYMILDLDTTYFPNGNRDNFGKQFGQNMYNWEWFIGDRTSILSYGWFEFWDINGFARPNAGNPRRTNDPFGLDVITSGISLNRPPRGNIFIGYSVINTGPIHTSALNTSLSYWMSPKWYGTFSTSYDFGNAILLGSTFAITKIGPDFLTSVGLTVDPQRNSFNFGFEVAPRLSPSVRLGGGAGGTARFDPRFAPTQ